MTFASNPSDRMSWRELLDADWSRLLALRGEQQRPRRVTSFLAPRFFSVALIRTAHVLYRSGWRVPAKFFSLVNFAINGIEAPASLPIGPGLVIPHSQGIIIGAGYIGCNVTIYQQVTLGAKFADFGFDPASRPHVGDGVIITAGAKVIGPYQLGENALIGANAVVLSDVPANYMAVGVPARIIKRRTEIDQDV